MKPTLSQEQQLDRQRYLAQTKPPHIGYVLLLILFYFVTNFATSFISLLIQVLNKVPFDQLGTAMHWYENALNTLFFIILLYLCKRLNIHFFSKEKIPLNQWLLAGGGFIFMFVASSVIDYIGTTYNLYTETLNESILQDMVKNTSYAVMFYAVVILAPIVEEVVFRGLIMGYLFPKKKLLGYFVATLLFTLVHVPTDFISFLLYFIPAAGLGFVYYKTKRIELTIAMHFLNNFISTLFS